MNKFAKVYLQMQKQNETAAVDMYTRFGIGVVGLLVTSGIFIFADGIYKYLGFMFLVFPVLLVAAGLIMDYNDAKRTLLRADS